MRYLFIILFLTSVPFFLIGELEEEYINSRVIVAQKIIGLVITGEDEKPPAYVLDTLEGGVLYRTKATEYRSVEEKFMKGIEKVLLHSSVTCGEIEDCKEKIRDFYERVLGMIVYVSVEMAESGSGDIIIFKVQESLIGKIIVKGNRWFKDDYYIDSVSQLAGEEVDKSRLVSDMGRINRYPWQKVEVKLNEGEEVSLKDVEIFVEDERPFSISSGGDNSGLKVCGYGKIYGCLEFGNVDYLDNSVKILVNSSFDLSTWLGVDVAYRSYIYDSGVVGLQGIVEYVDRDGGVDAKLWGWKSFFPVYFIGSEGFAGDIFVGFEGKVTNSDCFVNGGIFSEDYLMLYQFNIGVKRFFVRGYRFVEGGVEFMFAAFWIWEDDE